MTTTPHITLTPLSFSDNADVMSVRVYDAHWGTIFVDRSKWYGDGQAVDLYPPGHTMNVNIISNDLSIWVKAQDLMRTLAILVRMEEVPF